MMDEAPKASPTRAEPWLCVRAAGRIRVLAKAVGAAVPLLVTHARRPSMAKDPVCGMTVDEKKAATAAYGGKTYYFCSVGCKATFEKAPYKFATMSPRGQT